MNLIVIIINLWFLITMINNFLYNLTSFLHYILLSGIYSNSLITFQLFLHFPTEFSNMLKNLQWRWWKQIITHKITLIHFINYVYSKNTLYLRYKIFFNPLPENITNTIHFKVTMTQFIQISLISSKT